jgi:hypothetical protein
LKPWESAGLGLHKSSLLWAQEFLSGSGQECEPTSHAYEADFNAYSWISAKNFYYQAVKTGSNALWAKTFRALGQVMHLLADSAVPAHVRNDPHLADPYEKWVANNFGNIKPKFLNNTSYKAINTLKQRAFFIITITNTYPCKVSNNH